MAGTTRVGWTDATANIVVGCAPVGPGCERCFAAALAKRRWDIIFEVGGRRWVTNSGIADPLKWQRMHDRGQKTMVVNGVTVPVPVWVFFGSLGDFFDKEWPDGVRDEGWDMIRRCPSLRPQLVTKRLGNVPGMLPKDWNNGQHYKHVGIIGTMVNQDEVNRDIFKLELLKAKHGVRWIGMSIEPELGGVDLTAIPFQGAQMHNALTGETGIPGGDYPIVTYDEHAPVDWVIGGGESKQDERPAREYHLEWGESLIAQCAGAGVPYFQKQMGDSPVYRGKPVRFKGKGTNVEDFPSHMRVQQMPIVFDNDPPREPPAKAPPAQQSLF